MASDGTRETIVDARMAELRARYGTRFDDEQQARLREEVGKLYDAGQGLRAMKLTNADEPELVFRPRTEA